LSQHYRTVERNELFINQNNKYKTIILMNEVETHVC